MRSPRFAITLAFLVDGLLVGSWAARIPAIKHQAHLSTPELGVTLFALSLGALVTMPVAGWLCERRGSRAVVVAGLLVGAGALVLAAYAPDQGGLAAALLLFGAGFGAVNVAANAQGLAFERRRGRSVLSSFHAAYSAGGLLGAGIGALAAAVGVGPELQFGAIGLLVATTALAAGRRLLPAAEASAAAGRVLIRPPAALVMLGVTAFFALLCEGAAADWSALYLSHSLGASAAVAAVAYTGFALAMAMSRTFGDRLHERLGPVVLVRGGGVAAATGLMLALAVGTTAVALTGFALMGAGLGVIVPVLFRSAGQRPGVPAGIGVAAVSTIGFLGFLAGPPAIGLAAGTVGLRDALWIVVLSAGIVVLLAGGAIRGCIPSIVSLAHPPARDDAQLTPVVDVIRDGSVGACGCGALAGERLAAVGDGRGHPAAPLASPP
jgi:MFS family permease